MKNLSIIEEEERFWNWYQGYSNFYLPYEDLGNGNKYTYMIKSYLTSASYKTQFFGNAFDPEKVKHTVIMNSSLNTSALGH